MVTEKRGNQDDGATGRDRATPSVPERAGSAWVASCFLIAVLAVAASATLLYWDVSRSQERAQLEQAAARWSDALVSRVMVELDHALAAGSGTGGLVELRPLFLEAQQRLGLAALPVGRDGRPSSGALMEEFTAAEMWLAALRAAVASESDSTGDAIDEAIEAWRTYVDARSAHRHEAEALPVGWETIAARLERTLVSSGERRAQLAVFEATGAEQRVRERALLHGYAEEALGFHARRVRLDGELDVFEAGQLVLDRDEITARFERVFGEVGERLAELAEDVAAVEPYPGFESLHGDLVERLELMSEEVGLLPRTVRGAYCTGFFAPPTCPPLADDLDYQEHELRMARWRAELGQVHERWLTIYERETRRLWLP